MSRPTRRQVLYGSAAAVTGAVLAAPAAFADSPAGRPAAARGDSAGHGHSAGAGPSGGHQMAEPFDEVYQGRHIEGWPTDDGGHGGHGGHQTGRAAGPHEGMDFVVRIDNDDLHVMRNADGTWISLVNHYETFTTPRALARAAVRELQGADLVPVVTG
ncbi:tyrosinase family oxidase copper chaperone [Streptomyces sp. NPDC127097]|uniref:apotyrosinase chaperone MelC1 n=1 Tax=Streptomyces sp. NPDC127097 TaxID=3347136 RepID=UPI00364C0A8C